MISIKKKLKFIIGVLLIILISFTFPLKGRAEKSLSIDRWLIDSNIRKNGDLEIFEDITFNFNGEFNGVFREIVLDGTEGIDNIQIAEMIEGNEIEYTYVNEAKNGDDNVFTTIDDGDSINIKIFSPSKDEVKTFRLSYTIKNVAVKYKDTGELYYKFLGKDNNTPINFLSANIKLPETITDRVQIFAHGP